MNPPIYVFSAPWFAFVGLLAVAGGGLWAIGRRLDQRGRRRLLLWAVGANLVCFASYMVGLASTGSFPAHVVYDMPLQLCSLVTFSLAPAIVLDIPVLRGFCYFIGCLAGFLALFSPATGIEGVGVFSPLAIGFFGSHGLNVVIGALIAAFGLYQPSYKGAFMTLAFFLALVAAMALLNVSLRLTVLPQANYFYFFDPEGADILVALHNLVGVPILYLFPVAPLLVGALLLQAAIYRGGSRLARRLSRPAN
ncbi:MAG: YwaF family protein [Bifidobacteriaceae bacterium]|jgi:uncharacterized membrane protein YwaF|nr:YwaF family protein [Bifidobacteriaceae bacterium]